MLSATNLQTVLLTVLCLSLSALVLVLPLDRGPPWALATPAIPPTVATEASNAAIAISFTRFIMYVFIVSTPYRPVVAVAPAAFAFGMVMIIVRFVSLKYFLATRCTSSFVTAETLSSRVLIKPGSL